MRATRESIRRFELTLDLFDAGVELMRSNLQRRHPSASRREIDGLLVGWRRLRPGAEHGDAEGRPVAVDDRLG